MVHNNRKTVSLFRCAALLLIFLFLASACSQGAPGLSPEYPAPSSPNQKPTDSFVCLISEDNPSGNPESQNPVFSENPFLSVASDPVSTFSSDVDTASYSYFRSLVTRGQSLNSLIKNFGTSFRTEEMVNYFSYDSYASPAPGELFGVTSEVAVCPWNDAHLLLRVGLRAKETEKPSGGNNLVFLIDVSGSMYSDDKLPLLKKAFTYLVEELDENDRVSIVTYSGCEKVVLEACPGDQKDEILQAINSLKASGSTNGESGLRMAYQIAASCKIEGGNNRILMASDGDLNVGISSAAELKEFVSLQRESGIYLSVLGFGYGNYQDQKMETLADNGNGVYYYIDGEEEAERIFSSELTATLYTVGEDVKLQITFDPTLVSSYRLCGYENRMLCTEDFEDDRKDAGEVGSGQTLTVVYELIPANSEGDPNPNASFGTLSVRYKNPGETESRLSSYSIGLSSLTDTPSDDFLFAMAVVETAMILHKSEYLSGNESPAQRLSHLHASLLSLDLSDQNQLGFCDLLQKLTQ